jgi:hypothetical protein
MAVKKNSQIFYRTISAIARFKRRIGSVIVFGLLHTSLPLAQQLACDSLVRSWSLGILEEWYMALTFVLFFPVSID